MVNARDLRHRIEVLTLFESEEGFAWQASGKLWADAKQTGKRNLFSAVGLGMPTVQLTIRRCALTLHNALRLHGRHCFLTAIAPHDDRGYLTVTAALAEPVTCTVTRRKRERDPVLLRPTLTREQTVQFPAVRTEKYVRFEDGMPNNATEQVHVLVMPKTVTLAPGELVDIGGETWRVQIGHELGEFKNEYEIVRKEDA